MPKIEVIPTVRGSSKVNMPDCKKTTTIALLCTALNERGGTSRHLLKLYAHLSKEYRVLVVYCSHEDKLLGDFFIQGGVSSEDLFSFKTDKHFIFIPLILQLRKVFIKQKVDILHTFFLHSDILGFFAARLAGLKCLVSSVEGKFLWDEVNGVNKLKQLCYKFANSLVRKYFHKTITVSRELAEELLAYKQVPESKVININVGIDIPSLARIELKSQGDQTKKIVVGSLGRFSKDKGLDNLLQAIPYVVARIPDIKFVLAGGGAGEGEIRELADKLNIAKNVEFCGWVADVEEFLKTIDIFAFPSRREGCPAALLEALSFQRPIVAFAIPSLKEIITDRKNGILIEPFNIEKFAAALINLSNDPEYTKRLGQEGRALIQEKFSIESEIRAIKNVYFQK